MGLGLGGGVQGVVHDRLDGLLWDGGLAAPTLGHLADALHAVGLEASPPGQDGAPAHTDALGDLGVGDAVGGHQERLRVKHLSMRARGRPGDHLELLPVLRGHRKRRGGAVRHP